ncbi:unnamed protein product, partial [Brachionus calyciflorus]
MTNKNLEQIKLILFKCEKCGKLCEIKSREDVVDRFVWRCSCSWRRTIRKNTFIGQFVISLQLILKLILHWALQTSQTDQSKLLGLSRETIVTFQQKLRLIACQSLNKDSVKLGGRNKIVEIDESFFVKVKNFKGKDLKRPQIWIFGMHERESPKTIFVVVKKRDAFTLLN